MNSSFEKALSTLKNGEIKGVMKNIGNALNSFSKNYEDFLGEIRGNETACETFKRLVSFCLLANGYQYMVEEKHHLHPHWDERDKASRRLCYQSYDAFNQMVRDQYGYDILKPDAERKFERFQDDLSSLFKEKDIVVEANYFIYNEHPTLRQSIVRLIVQFFEYNKDSNPFPDNYCLPFI